MTNIKKLNLWLIGLIFIFSLLPIEAKLSIPKLDTRIMDSAELFSTSEKHKLESKLIAFEKENPGAQIAVLTLESLEGENLESYSLKVANSWALGSKKNNDGVLILVAM